MRSLLILLLLPGALASAAPYPFAWGSCTSFEPSAAEIYEVVEQAKSQMPSDAEFQEACFTEEPAVIGVAQMGVVREERFRFFWTTGESHRGLTIVKEGLCHKNRFGRVKCDTVPNTFVDTPASELIYLYGVKSARELYELLEFRDRFIGKDFQITDIHRESVLQDATTVGKRKYSLLGISEEEGRIAYSVVRRCKSVAECTWELIGPERWYH